MSERDVKNRFTHGHPESDGEDLSAFFSLERNFNIIHRGPSAFQPAFLDEIREAVVAVAAVGKSECSASAVVTAVSDGSSELTSPGLGSA